MKTTYLWIVAVVIVLGGMWMFWPKNSIAPEATPTPSVTSTQTPTPTGVGATPTPSVKPKATPTRTPTPTATPTPANVITPNITSVTPYETMTYPVGWWIRITGTVPGGTSNSCYQMDAPSFSENNGVYDVTLTAHLAPASMCMLSFTQTIYLGSSSVTPGMHTVFVNGQQWTSFIVPTPTPTPTPTPSPLY
jgi:hypothetical protein